MIDTIRFECDRPYLPEIIDALKGKTWSKSIAPGWKAPYHRGPYVEDGDSGNGEKMSSIQFIHEATGAKVWGDLERIRKVEVSLPRLLHGTNGRLISSPEELDHALARLEAILGELSIPEKPILDLLRLDLVWNVYCDPQQVLRFIRTARWPKIRNDPAIFSNPDEHQKTQLTSIRFAGKDIVLQMYDKKAEMKGKHNLEDRSPSHSLRIEVQLKSKERIRREFNEEDLGMIDTSGSGFSTLYQVYRRLVMLLNPTEQFFPETGITKDSLLAMGEVYHQILELHGLAGEVPWKASPLQLYAAEGPKPDTLRKCKKRVNDLQFQFTKFDWNEFLPKQAPPAGVDIYSNGKEVVVPSHWFFVPEHWDLPHEF